MPRFKGYVCVMLILTTIQGQSKLCHLYVIKKSFFFLFFALVIQGDIFFRTSDKVDSLETACIFYTLGFS